MSHKTFLAVSGTIFGVVTLVHLARLLAGWTVHIGAFEVPMWFSWAGLVVAGYLAFSAFRLRGGAD
jgi:hypothetical protein